MTDLDYPTERHKLLEELRHHHGGAAYVAIDRTGATPTWVVGADEGEGFPQTWAGLPIRYEAQTSDVPRSSTRDWVRRTNPLHPDGG